MHLLSGTLRSYPWGSRTAIAQLCGRPAPSDSPEAELWFGAHPAGPSLLDGTALTELIAEDPDYHLGERVRGKFGDKLPFLLKILAADEPLSLQAHPSRVQAEEGFARENAAGIDISAGDRNYKDDNHKPEIIVALTEFEAMAGFRTLERTMELVKALDCPELDRYTTMLDANNETGSLRALFTTWITIPAAARGALIDALVSAARAFLTQEGRQGRPAWMVEAVENVVLLSERYPGDVGILGAFLLNKLTLAPGEAMYLDAGELHAYVRGLGVELMANSDNVLRGGLTTKHVDVPELVRVLTFRSLTRLKIEQDVVNKAVDHVRYPVPIDEFALESYRLWGERRVQLDHDGPSIALCTAGALRLDNGEGELVLRPGMAAWLPAAGASISVESADGAAAETEAAQLFVASV